MIRLALAAILAISMQVKAGERESIMAHGSDLVTTAAGLSMGASEANILGPGLVLTKTAAWAYGRRLPATQQPAYWDGLGAVGWAASANNLCVIGSIASVFGGALCPVLGIVAGISIWNAGRAERERATFDAICADAQALQPELVCTYTIPTALP